MNIIIAGDFCPMTRVNDLIKGGRYDTVFPAELCEVVNKTDYSIVNLECPIMDDIYVPIPKYGPNLRTSSRSLDAIKYAGFKCCTLANNHILDYGQEAMEDTLLWCENQGFDVVGGVKI